MSRWGQARVEVLAHHQEIKDELARGVPVKQVYDVLLKSGRVTVTYNGFRRQVQSIRDDLLRAPVAAPETSSVIVRPTERSNPPEGKPKSGFVFDPTSKIEDFF